ncbi:hypothetical protein ABK040_015973 [Willaertia magna]
MRKPTILTEILIEEKDFTNRLTEELKELKNSEQKIYKDIYDRPSKKKEILKRKLWNIMYKIKYCYEREDFNKLVEERISLKKELKDVLKRKMKKIKKEKLKRVNKVNNFEIYQFDKILNKKIINWNKINFEGDIPIKEQILNSFKNKFQKNVNTEEKVIQEFIQKEYSLETITPYDIQRIIKKAKSKSADYYEATFSFYKNHSERFYVKLTEVANRILNNELDMPEAWKKSWIKLIPKKVIPQGPNDVRPISILPVIYRIITKAITEKIDKMVSTKMN